MCVKDTGTKYQLWISDFNIDGTFTRVHPFIISHTKTMTRTGINYDKANEFCANRGDWITMIDYLEYCAIQALYYIEYANFDNQAALNTNLTSDGFKQGGLGAGVTNLN
jgi:hypothetical protein